MSNKFTVTAKGKAALLPPITLASDTIELKDGAFGVAWTMQATYHGESPQDDEGWAPWAGLGTNNVESLLGKGYIEVVNG